MKKLKTRAVLAAVLILLLGIYYYAALPAINIHAAEFWVFLTHPDQSGGGVFRERRRT